MRTLICLMLLFSQVSFAQLIDAKLYTCAELQSMQQVEGRILIKGKFWWQEVGFEYLTHKNLQCTQEMRIPRRADVKAKDGKCDMGYFCEIDYDKLTEQLMKDFSFRPYPF